MTIRIIPENYRIGNCKINGLSVSKVKLSHNHSEYLISAEYKLLELTNNGDCLTHATINIEDIYVESIQISARHIVENLENHLTKIHFLEETDEPGANRQGFNQI